MEMADPPVKIKIEPEDKPDVCQNYQWQVMMPGPVEAMPNIIDRYKLSYNLSGHVPTNSWDVSMCEVCQLEFTDAQMLQMHKFCHFNTSNVCYVCDMYFTDAKIMMLHITSIHRNLVTLPRHSDERDWFVCPICLMRFSSKKALVSHQEMHQLEDGKSYTCRICGLDFIGIRALVSHLSSPRHAEMKVKIQSIFVCVDCRSIFVTRDSYAMHMMERAQNESCKTVKEYAQGEAAAEVDIKSQECEMKTAETLDKPLDLVKNKDAEAEEKYEQEIIPAVARPQTTTPTFTGVQSHPFHCLKCNKDFMTQDGLAMHVMMHIREDAGLSPLSHNKMYPELTGASRPNSAPMGSAGQTSQPKQWKCSKCLLCFETQDTLAMHVMDTHSREARLSLSTFNSSLKQKETKTPSQSRVTSVPIMDQNKAQQSLMQRPKRALSLPSSSITVRELIQSSKIPRLETVNTEKVGEGSGSTSSDTKLVLEGADKGLHSTIQSLSSQYLNTMDLIQHIGQYNISKLSPRHSLDQLTSLVTVPPSNSCPMAVSPAFQLMSSAGQQVMAAADRKCASLGFQTQQLTRDGYIQKTPEAKHRMEVSDTQTRSCSPIQSPEPSGQSISSDTSDHNVSAHQPDTEGSNLLNFLMANASKLMMCKHCQIVFMDKTVYYLHMGLHNLNNPWQCNLCGKVCKDVHEFSSHVIHY